MFHFQSEGRKEIKRGLRAKTVEQRPSQDGQPFCSVQAFN